MKRVTYCPIGEPQRQFGVYLTGAGFEKTLPGEDYPHEYHSSDYYFTWNHGRTLPDGEYQLLYIHSGRGILEFVRRKPIEITSGALVILRPGEWHRYRPNSMTGWEEAYIGIGGEMLDRIFRPPFFTASQTVLYVQPDGNFEQSFYELVNDIKSFGTERPYSISLKVLSLLATLFETPNRPATLINHNTIIRKSTLFIGHHLAETIDFPALAKNLGMGYSLFRKCFNAYTGLAPLEYLTSLRIRRACHLLDATDLSITQIALDTGFKSPAYFARFFRTRLNISPSDYRASKRLGS